MVPLAAPWCTGGQSEGHLCDVTSLWVSPPPAAPTAAGIVGQLGRKGGSPPCSVEEANRHCAGAGQAKCCPSRTLLQTPETLPCTTHTGSLFCGLSCVCSSHPLLLGGIPPMVQKRSMSERPQATDSCSGHDREPSFRKRGGAPGRLSR